MPKKNSGTERPCAPLLEFHIIYILKCVMVIFFKDATLNILYLNLYFYK